MKIYLFLLLTFISTISLYAKWEKASGFVEDVKLNSFAVANDNSIFACTNYKLLKSTDNGKTWAFVPTDQDKYSVNYFSDMNMEPNGDLIIQSNHILYKLKKNHSIVKTSPFIAIDVMYYDTIYNKMAFIYDYVGIFGYQDLRYFDDNTQSYVNIGNSYSKLKHRYINTVTSSKKNGIVANFNYDDIFKICFNLYKCSFYTLDTGKTWIQFDTIPGTNIYGTEFLVLDDNLWLFNSNVNNYKNSWKIYNTKLNKLEDLNLIENQVHFSKFQNTFAVYTKHEIILIDNDGNIIKSFKNILTKNSINTIKKVQISNNGLLYILNENGDLFSMDINTDAFNQIKLNGVLNSNLNHIQKSSNALYCTNSKDRIYYSLDAGKNWESIKISNPNEDKLRLQYSVNKHNELVFSYKDSVYYTNDFGKTIKIIQKDYYSGFDTQYLKIFDNGAIYVNSNIGYFSNSKNEILNAINLFYFDLVQVSDSSYLGIDYSYIYLIDKNFKKTEIINFSFVDKFEANSAKFIVDENNKIYLHTKNGLKIFDNTNNLFIQASNIYSPTFAINNLNDFYFIRKDQIISNTNNNSYEENLDLVPKKEMIIMDSTLILLSDDCYYNKIENKNHLNLIQINKPKNGLTYDTCSIEFNIVDENNNPVENAKIYIKNDYNMLFDSIYSDKNGMIKYKLNKKKDGYKVVHLCLIAEKDGYYKSEITNLYIVQTYNNMLTLRLKDNMFIQENYPGETIEQNIEMYYIYQINIPQGRVIVRNYYNNTIDTIVSTDSKFLYKFQIPDDAKMGLYRLEFIPLCSECDSSIGIWSYFIVQNKKYLDIIEDKQPLKELKIYPNPSSEFITIEENNEIQNESLMIYASDGTLVLNSRFSNKIDISKLSNGLYYVVIGNKVGKFIKQ